jgi:protein ImuB
MRRVVSLYLPRWTMERRGASDAAPAHRPAVLALSIGNQRLVSAVNPAAEAQGLLPGLALADARAQVPNLAVAPADPEGDAAALLRLAQWCSRYSPWTVPHGVDGVLLDITGCAHLAGGEDKLGADLIERLSQRGLTGSLGIADTIGGAWALARGGENAVNIAASGDTRVVLAPLPVRVLRLDQEMVAALGRLGLRRIGDLYPLSRADLAARFDPVLMARLDEALGAAKEPLSPLPPRPPRWARRGFAEPIATPDDIAAATRLLLETLCRSFAEEGLGARLLTLVLHRVDGESVSIAIGTARPSRDVGHLMRLFAERLGLIDPGLGIEDMVLAAKTVEKLEAKQLALPAAAAPSNVDDIAPLIDRLANRLGAQSVGRLLPHDAHLPERAQRFVFAFAPGGGEDRDGKKQRPVRLLPRPEPIEAVAPVPDDPPRMFRWRRRLHQVVRAEGPERIMGEWWRGNREAKLLRDYYRVEDQDGRRYWLFRSGHYRPAVRARWFMHGFFA